MVKKWRLPDQLGGGEFVGEFTGYVKGQYRYEGTLEGIGTTHLALPYRLQEILPPSIDDPVALPLALEDVDGEDIRLSDALGHTDCDDTCVGLLEVGVVSAHVSRDHATKLAQALWQARNASA